VPLQALIAAVPVETPAMMMLYVVPSKLNVPVLLTVMYCGVDGDSEVGKVMIVLDDVTFQLPEVIVCVCAALPAPPA
jgi:hypothetical protein